MSNALAMLQITRAALANGSMPVCHRQDNFSSPFNI